MGVKETSKAEDPSARLRSLSARQYAAFLLLPPIFMGLIAGSSEFGSVEFSTKFAHIGFGLFTYSMSWLSLELMSQLSARLLAPWRTPLWLVLVCGTILTAQLHAPLTLIRDPLFQSLLADGSSFYQSWPWNYTDPDYLMEASLAFSTRLMVWLPANFLLVSGLGFVRLGHEAFFRRSLIATESDHAENADIENTPAETPLGLLASRLPAELGSNIQLLKAQEHYTQVFTDKGDALVYMRFSDAEGLVSAKVDGMRVHRSFWVAFEAAKSVEFAGSKLSISLKSGQKVPVSRTYRNQAKAAFEFLNLQ